MSHPHLPRPVTQRKPLSTHSHSPSLPSWSSRFPRKSAIQKTLLAALVTLLIVTYFRSSSPRGKREYAPREAHWLLDDTTSARFEMGAGEVVGAHGEFFGIQEDTARVEKATTPQPVIPAPAASELLDGLPEFPPNNPRAAPLTKLGAQADNTFKLGPTTRKAYVQALDAFIKTSWPEKLQARLGKGLERYMDGEEGALWRTERMGGEKGKGTIWMTDKDRAGHQHSADVGTWRDNGDGWDWKMLEDSAANDYVTQQLSPSRISKVYSTLPPGIRRSDALRYLLLLLNGGVYSDTDTKLLKPISEWGRQPVLWKDGKGWLSRADRVKMQEEGGLPPPSVIVGIEADVGEDREDWNNWWPRPLQIVQWTIASAPSHPIFLDALYMILRQTATALQWQSDKPTSLAALEAEGEKAKAKQLKKATLAEEPEEGGPLSVMEWTGPGLFSDSVLRYLRVKYGLTWPELRGLQVPLRVGDVVILPVTGFSPNVGLFNAQTSMHEQAMVAHGFAGSWKKDDD